MDALTQLLESYLSTRANPVADGLALRGLAAARDGLLAWHEMAVAGLGGAAASDGARAAMATAALCSGICLAQTGLGAVHGVASPLGALFPIPHGVACGATLAAATRVNVAVLEQREPENVALGRYAELGRLLAGKDAAALPDGEARAALVHLLDDWRARLAVPRLSACGITAADIPADRRRLARQQHEDEPDRAHRRRDRRDTGGVALRFRRQQQQRPIPRPKSDPTASAASMPRRPRYQPRISTSATAAAATAATTETSRYGACLRQRDGARPRSSWTSKPAAWNPRTSSENCQR